MRYKVTIESIANEKELEDEDTDELKVSHTTDDIAWSIRFCIDSASTSRIYAEPNRPRNIIRSMTYL